jgi:hypothetical protein
MNVITLSDETAASIVAFLNPYLATQRASFGGESSALRELFNAIIAATLQASVVEPTSPAV